MLRSVGIRRSVLAVLSLLIPVQAIAGNWGENWGEFLWNSVAPPTPAPAQAIPVDSIWMIAAMVLVLAALGVLRLRKQNHAIDRLARGS
jgi:hypothetical protein